MSNIYEKIVGDKTLVLTARDGFMRKFNFGSWTDMAVGIYFTGIVGNNTTISTQENITIATHADRMTFGLKNSTNTILPGFEGSYFIGACTTISNTAASALVVSYGDNNGKFPSVCFDGTTVVAGGDTSHALDNNNMAFPSGGGTGATGYNGFYGIRFIISNIGTATQTVTVKFTKVDTVAGTDYSTAALVTQINNATWSTTVGGALAWNDGSSAYPIPDAFWIRMPFYTNIIRISSVAAVKFT
jgi:hypothetical protein